MKIRKLTKKEIASFTGAIGAGLFVAIGLNYVRNNPTKFMSYKLLDDIVYNLAHDKRIAIQFSDAVSEIDVKAFDNYNDSKNVRLMLTSKNAYKNHLLSQ